MLLNINFNNKLPMKTFKLYALVLIAITLLANNTYAQEVNDSIPSREKGALQTMTGTVKTIVAETREITLMGENGELTTITAGEEVERFNEIEIGDAITFDSYLYMKA